MATHACFPLCVRGARTYFMLGVVFSNPPKQLRPSNPLYHRKSTLIIALRDETQTSDVVPPTADHSLFFQSITTCSSNEHSSFLCLFKLLARTTYILLPCYPLPKTCPQASSGKSCEDVVRLGYLWGMSFVWVACGDVVCLGLPAVRVQRSSIHVVAKEWLSCS